MNDKDEYIKELEKGIHMRDTWIDYLEARMKKMAAYQETLENQIGIYVTLSRGKSNE